MSADSLPIKGLLSNVYGILSDRELKLPLAYQRAWEADLGRLISLDSWKSLWNSVLHTSRNTNVSMLTYKILYRWHLTPLRLHKINSSVPDKCWKGCGLLGFYIHCFWSCPRIQPFWRQVIFQINLIAEITLPHDPAGIILNIWRSLNLDPLKKELIGLMLCTARSLIVQYWKNCKIPSLSDWYLELWDLFLQGKISVSVLQADNYPVPENLQEKWLPLLSAVSSKLIDTSLFSHHTHHDLLSYF